MNSQTEYQAVSKQDKCDVETRITVLPAYNKETSTFWYCLAATTVSILLSVLCITVAAIVIHRDPSFPTLLLESWVPSDLSPETMFEASKYKPKFLSVATLALNLFVAFGTDGMGFAHATSLRWALYREGKLEFNTNLRLFRSANSAPNRWYMNLLSAISLISCYAATSVLFPISLFESHLNATALLALGLGLLGKAFIAGLCLYRSKQDVLTWSSNPLNNALACLHGGLLQQRPERCMLSVHQAHSPSEPTRPLRRQGNAWSADPPVKAVVLFTWVLTALSWIWFTIAICTTRKYHLLSGSSSDSPIPFTWESQPSDPDPSPGYHPVVMELSFLYDLAGNDILPVLQLLYAFLFAFLIQGLQTIGLHCIELIFNLSRDETTWSSALSRSGTRLSISPLVSALRNWKYILLVVLKATLHWLIGQSMQMHVLIWEPGVSEVEFIMLYPRLCIYAIAATVTAAFTTWIAVWKTTSMMPATWGNLQTIADLVDFWETDENGKLWWGDKGEKLGLDGIRHAGTANYKLSDVWSESLYAGEGEIVKKKVQ